MTLFTTISNPQDIDLDKHAIIEASAGTGKTYTITALVMRLLAQGVALEKILIVTFTEKATAELRDRIRDKIKEQFDRAPEQLYLKKALNSFTNAKIFTIHGFCQRVLQENAFENKGVFDLEVADDKPIYRDQLNKLKRTWPAIEGIENILDAAGYSENWEQNVIRLAMNIDHDNDALFPFVENKASLEATLKSQLTVLQQSDRRLIEDEYRSLIGQPKCTENRWSTNNETYFVPAWNFIEDFTDADIYTCELAWMSKGLKAASFSYYPNLIEANSGLTQLYQFFDNVENFDRTRQKLIDISNHEFTINTMKRLSEGVKAYKAQKGMISFSDMIGNLYDALNQERDSAQKLLSNKLRDEFNYGLIDEFQDTDLKQWDIFKTIFMGSDAHRLMLIGDPKQAIYSFRGADVHAYEKAKQELIELGDHKTQGYKLGTNYRSMPDLVDSINQFWKKTFYPNNEANVDSPSDQHRQKEGPLLGDDSSGFDAFNTYEMDAPLAVNTRQLKYGLAKKVAQTINALNGKLQFTLKGQTRRLNYSDICVLVRGKSEALILEQELKRLFIPASFYKKPGIYDSEEAIHFQILLSALAMPARSKLVSRAMLTLFLDLKPSDVPAFEAEKLPQQSEFWLKLLELAEERAWPRFFRHLLDDSGAIYRATYSENWRRIANVKQIAQDLQKVAIEENLDALALCRHLADRRVNSKDEDLHNKDTEKPAVKILTMHSSKGLEFPVVFLYGAFSKGNHSDIYQKYYDEKLGKTVYDLSKSSMSAMQLDEREENMRLFYVAFTRAVFKLFIPKYAMHFMGTQYQGAYTTLVNNELQNDTSFHVDKIHNEWLNEAAAGVDEQIVALATLIKPPSNTQTRVRRLHSFTGLSSLTLKTDHQDISFGTGAASHKQDENPNEAEDQNENAADETLMDLPHGARTGNILHGIFENIDFECVGTKHSVQSFLEDDSLMSVVDAQMNEFGMVQYQAHDNAGKLLLDYRVAFAQLVWHTLSKKISALGNRRLADIALIDRKHELEFHFHHGSHYLTGFIDLFFRIGKRYYILDWKSNFSPLGYKPQVLSDNVMLEHNYTLQYCLYALAMQRWFDSLGFEQGELAGAVYVFSRGIDAATDDDNGIYFDDFSTISLDEVGQEFMSLAKKKEWVS